jgi:hypothetical protein
MNYLDSLFVEETTEEPAVKNKKIDIYKELATNIKKSSSMRSEINKAINNKEDTKEILIKAIECIYLMTGDDIFRTNKDKI